MRLLHKNILREILLGFAIFSTMLDSGGEIGLRNWGLGILLLLAFFRPCLKFPRKILIGWLFFLTLITPSVFRSVASGVDFSSILLWTYPVVFFPFVYNLVASSKLNSNCFLNAGALFSATIIILFIGRVTGNEFLIPLNDFLTLNAAGFFNEKTAFFGEAMPVVYFQGTLSLVFVSILALGQKKYFLYFLMLTALVLAPSRFGVATSIILGVVFFATKIDFVYRKKYSILFLFFCMLSVLTVLYILINKIGGDADGTMVRMGHLQSLASIFNDDVTKLLIGSGPGSYFYSSGIGQFTDNIEISQLELVRKYGLLFFIALTYFIFYESNKYWKNNTKSISLAIVAQYIVAMSNPVLFSLPFILFFCILYKKEEPY